MGNSHHIYGPSSLERRMLCPGSKRMELTFWELPEEKSEDAQEGQRLHDAMAGSGDYDAMDMDDRMLIDKCLSCLEEYKDWPECYKEKSIDSCLFSGTLDVLLIRGEEAVIIDWKFGRIEVKQARENIQLAAYAFLAFRHRAMVKTVTVRIIQPRLNLDTQYTYSVEDYECIKANLEQIIAECEKPDARCFPSDKQCKYCKAQQVCPALQEQMGKLIQTEVSALKPIKEWRDDEISTWFSKFKVLEKFANDVKADLKRRIQESGNPCGIWSLGKPTATRSIENIELAFGMASELGIDSKAFIASCKVSVPKLQEMLANAIIAKAEFDGEKMTLKTGKAKAGEMLEPIIAKKEQEASLERKAENAL